MHIPNNESEQVLSVQHGINCRRKESQISEPGDATMREKAPNPFHLSRRKAVSFANLKTFVPGSPFARSLFGHGAFHSDRLVSAHSPRHRGSLMWRFARALRPGLPRFTEGDLANQYDGSIAVFLTIFKSRPALLDQ